MSSLFLGIIIIAAIIAVNTTFKKNIDTLPRIIGSAVMIILVMLILGKGLFFIADSDQSYVVQWPTGKLMTCFEPGPKIKLYGKVYPYDRVISVATPTFVAETGNETKGKDMDAVEEESSTVSGTLPPPLVRFTDAAKGNAYGIVRVALPTDHDGLLKIHRELGSIDALINNVLKNGFRSTAVASARLMSIQDYITKRGSDFDEFFSDQFSGGLYVTTVHEEVVNKTKPTEADKTSTENENVKKDNTRVTDEGKTIEEHVTIVRDKTGAPVRQGINDIARYGLQVITARITYVNPEARVIRLIGDQRDAEARAALAENKRRASLLEAEAEEAEGQKMVAKARASELATKETKLIKEETEKAATIIAAQRQLEQARLNKQQLEVKYEADKAAALIAAKADKEATLIAAAKKLEEAKLNKETAAVRAKEAEFKKQELILIGQGEAARQKLKMEADGALELKLEAYKSVMKTAFQEFAKQKWVPEVQMGGGINGTNGGNEAANLINLLTAKTLNDLGLQLTGSTTTTPTRRPVLK